MCEATAFHSQTARDFRLRTADQFEMLGSQKTAQAGFVRLRIAFTRWRRIIAGQWFVKTYVDLTMRGPTCGSDASHGWLELHPHTVEVAGSNPAPPI
jgi:hypothetical protein